MAFEELGKKGIEERVFSDPKGFFDWALEVYQQVKDENAMTPLGFSFFLFDRVSEVASPEDMKRIIDYAGSRGVKPWENVSGLRHQASTCLSGYIETMLAQKLQGE